MSGGVDSAVAAARAVDAGHDVTGVHLALSSNPQSFRSGARGCCTLEDARDARRAADVIGIPFYVWDMAERFRADVDRRLRRGVRRGSHPEPVPALQREDQVRGGPRQGPGARFRRRLHRSLRPHRRRPAAPRRRTRTRTSPTSSVCSPSTSWPARCSRSVRPTRPRYGVEADRRGLAVADKPDSHDICFIADGDTGGFLRDRIGVAPGPIVDTDGATIGEHDGAFAFTVGQRQGSAASAGRPPTASRATSSTSRR